MNPEEQITNPDSEFEALDTDSAESVDEFLRELEAKERDLHITADLSIEIEEADFDQDEVPAIVAEELAVSEDDRVVEKRGVNQQRGMKTRVYELEKEIERLNKRILELQSERDDIQESSDRRLKDFQNFKYRVDRERRGSFINQIANLATQLLPVLDNLDRAIETVEKSPNERSPEFQQFYEGIVLVNQQVNEVLSEMGVSPILTVGETFDPALHEAVAIIESDDLPHNTISEELLRGFRIGNRVIRHSMVKVSVSPQQSSKNPGITEHSTKIDLDESDLNLFDELEDCDIHDEAPASDKAPSQEAD